MKFTESLIRIAILIALLSVSLLLILNIEDDKSTWDFTVHVILDKSFGILGFYIFHLLYTKWSKIDPWIKAYDKYSKKGLNTPNPMRKQDKDYWQ